ncbi:MAG: hypothetical protein DDT30_01970 [Dehalococcoidia bacterium]|nr:hypothetical protein [Bacillota bacterium]
MTFPRLREDKVEDSCRTWANIVDNFIPGEVYNVGSRSAPEPRTLVNQWLCSREIGFQENSVIVSPTVFYHKGHRFFFFSREEERIHIHVSSGSGEAKFWLKPSVSLAQNYGLSQKELRKIQKIVEERKDEIEDSWRKHFPG